MTILLNNKNVSLTFWEYFFSKNPTAFITQNQEKIIDYSLECFPLLFSKTVFPPKKLTYCLFKLFKEPEKNVKKIEFIIENQKKNFLPFHNEMYYLVLFFAYMEENSESKRFYFSTVSNNFEYHPFKITEEFIFTARIIYDNFNDIFEFIKPNLIKKAYQGQSFSNTIINENDFSYFIDFVASSFQKNKLENRLLLLSKNNKSNIKKI